MYSAVGLIIISLIRLGVKTRVFHLGDYRRATLGPGQDVPDDYFFVNGESISRPHSCDIEVEALDDSAGWSSHGAGGLCGKRASSSGYSRKAC